MVMAETILSSPIISEAVLPFILIFTVVFAILQKSSILGKDKKQIDAMVALVFGLITITFARAVGIINQVASICSCSSDDSRFLDISCFVSQRR